MLLGHSMNTQFVGAFVNTCMPPPGITLKHTPNCLKKSLFSKDTDFWETKSLGVGQLWVKPLLPYPSAVEFHFCFQSSFPLMSLGGSKQ